MRCCLALSMIMQGVCATAVPSQAEPVKIVCTGNSTASPPMRGVPPTITLTVVLDDAARTVSVIDGLPFDDGKTSPDSISEVEYDQDRVGFWYSRYRRADGSVVNQISPNETYTVVYSVVCQLKISRDAGTFSAFFSWGSGGQSSRGGEWKGSCTKAEQKF